MSAATYWRQHDLFFQPVDDLESSITLETGMSEHSSEPQIFIAEEEASKESKESNSGPRNKKIVLVPGVNAGVSTEREIDYEFQKATRDRIELALNGDIEAAITVSLLITQCLTVPGNLQGLERQLNWAATRGRFPSDNHLMAGGSFRSFSSYEEYEAFVWNQYDQCQSTNYLLEGDLRERITQMAEDGHAVARYLYAMWLPKEGRLEAESIVDRLEYESRALEFTWQNVDENEPLGLLAFAQSYPSVRQELFTPRNLSSGQVLLVAAKKCGIESSWINTQLANIGPRWDEQQRRDYFAKLDSAATEINKLFCN